MKSKGRAPGEFKAEQERHQARQRLYDALKQMKDTGEGECSYKGLRYKLIDPLPLEPTRTQGLHGILGLVKFGRAIELCQISNKDGVFASSLISDRCRRIQWEDILAVAEQIGGEA